MSRSTDTLTKSTATDYKKMVSNGSIDSMDKSALGSVNSYDIYDTQNSQANGGGHAGGGGGGLSGGLSRMDTITPATTPGYNDLLSAKYNEYAAAQQKNGNGSPKKMSPKSTTEPKMYGLPEYNDQGFELAYRNEGFRDNSTYGGGTRTNSVSNYLNEETPIIHQIDPTGGGAGDETGSDYYGNSSTLPMRAKGDNLSFLSDLKHKLPEYEKLPSHHHHHNGAPSSFLPAAPPDPPYGHNNRGGYSASITPSSAGYTIQINSPSSPTKNEYQQPELRRPSPAASSISSSSFGRPTPPPPPVPVAAAAAADARRPQSYYTAMRSARESKPPSPPPPAPLSPPPPPLKPNVTGRRPKAVYEASGDGGGSGDDRRPVRRSGSGGKYARSKSEALLETNFDEDTSPPNPLTSDSRSYSQPLETAM